MRSVVLHELPAAAAVWRAYVLPWGDLQTVNVVVVLADPSFRGPYNCTLAFDNGTLTHVSAVAEAGKITLDGLKVPQPRVWRTTDPQLHTLTVKGAGGGGVVERFGLRSWTVDKVSGRLALNGKVLKLHGWNHHTQWPDTGAAPTDKQLDEDLALLKDAGTNFVRGGHYPQDQRWLDRLDEAGMVMWEETLGPNMSVPDLQDKAWMAMQLQQLDEMLDNAMNHASVMTWGWFNEGPSNDEKNCPAYKACADRAKERDPTRFTTWATDKDLGDKCLEHASLVSFNNYPMWYNHEDPTEQWNKFANGVRAGTTASGNVTIGRPFMISETGAGGIYEWDNATVADPVKWTLQFQSKIVSEDADVASLTPTSRAFRSGTSSTSRWAASARRTTRTARTCRGTAARSTAPRTWSTAARAAPTTRAWSTSGAARSPSSASSRASTTRRALANAVRNTQCGCCCTWHGA